MRRTPTKLRIMVKYINVRFVITAIDIVCTSIAFIFRVEERCSFTFRYHFIIIL